jgi:hypothetical protein
LLTPLLFTSLLTILCLGLSNCKKGDEGNGDGNGTKQPVKKADTHEQLATQALKLSSDLADVFAAVKDTETAKATAEKLDELYAQFENVNKRMEELGAPAGELKEKIEGMFQSKQKAIGERMQSAMAIFLGDQEIGQIVLPSLESFGARMEKLKAIELWEGEAAESE